MYGSKISSHKGEQIRLQKKERNGEGEMLIKIEKRGKERRVKEKKIGDERKGEIRGERSEGG